MNREKSGVAVVLPAYRSSRFLGDALESLFAQSLPPDEIIVVDDGSPEDEEGVVRPYLDRVSYVRTENRGPGAARNLGVSLTHSPLVAFLDADDLWEPQKLLAQVAYLRERPGCLLVGPTPGSLERVSRFGAGPGRGGGRGRLGWTWPP